MMRGLSAFLLPDVLALLGDLRRHLVDSQSQSETVSEDSESQASQVQHAARPPRLVMARSTDSARQTIALVDRDNCVEAFVPASVLHVLRSQLQYKSLARLRGSVLRLVKYQYVSRARLIASGQLEDAAAANWRASVSMASSGRRSQRLYLWIEELSVVDDNELVVDELPKVMEDEEVTRLLGGLTDAELEARLVLRQILPPLPAAVSAPASRLTDMAYVIPEDQEREQEEQDGWGPPPVSTARTLLTDSQLIEENGHVSMSELLEASSASDSAGQGLSARSHRELSASFPLEPTSPNVDGVRVLQQQQPSAGQAMQPSSSETEDEFETAHSPGTDDRGVDQDPGSVEVPIDLTVDDDQDESEDPTGGDSQVLRTANHIIDDADLSTQPIDDSTQEQRLNFSQGEDEASQDGQSQPQVVDDPLLSTQLPDTPGDYQDAQASESQPGADAQDKDGAHRASEAQAAGAAHSSLVRSSEGHESYEESDAEDAPTAGDVAARDDASNRARQNHEGQGHREGAEAQRRDKQTERRKSSEDGNVDHPRGLGDFFRRVASRIGMLPRKESFEHPPSASAAVEETSEDDVRAQEPAATVAQTARDELSVVESTPDSSANAEDAINSQLDDEVDETVAVEAERSQNPGELVDVPMWHTQAPEVEEASGIEHPPLSPSSSTAADFGYEPEQVDEEDVEMATEKAVVATTSFLRPSATQVVVNGANVSEDESHADLSVGAFASLPAAVAPYQAPASIGNKRAARELHSQPAQVRDGDVEEAKEEEALPASKRQRVSSRAQSPASSRSRSHDHPMLARLRGAEPPSSSVTARIPTTGRLSKRFEALFPPLRMDRILELIAEKKA